jgi:hypothetical protein
MVSAADTAGAAATWFGQAQGKAQRSRTGTSPTSFEWKISEVLEDMNVGLMSLCDAVRLLAEERSR